MKTYLSEQDLLSLVTGVNKRWLTTTINKQKQYGNYDCISAEIETSVYPNPSTITFYLGESWGVFRKATYGSAIDTWVRDYGNLYKEEQVTRLVNELAVKVGL